MFYIIYKITHNASGKQYIGKHQTKDVNDGYMGSGKLLRLAIEKYGRDSFSKVVLHIFDNENDMNAKERELVTEEFCQRKDTYNLCEGGKGGFGYINQSGIPKFTGNHSQQTREKISQAMSGKVRRPLSEETKKKISEYKKGKSNPSAKQPKTEEVKEKIRNSVKEYWMKRKAGLT